MSEEIKQNMSVDYYRRALLADFRDDPLWDFEVGLRRTIYPNNSKNCPYNAAYALFEELRRISPKFIECFEVRGPRQDVKGISNFFVAEAGHSGVVLRHYLKDEKSPQDEWVGPYFWTDECFEGLRYSPAERRFVVKHSEQHALAFIMERLKERS